MLNNVTNKQIKNNAIGSAKWKPLDDTIKMDGFWQYASGSDGSGMTGSLEPN